MLLNYMSGLYQKNYFNTVSSSQSGSGIRREGDNVIAEATVKATVKVNPFSRQWSVIVTVLFILVAIIIDVTTHFNRDTPAQQAMLGLWISMLVLYFFCACVVIKDNDGCKPNTKTNIAAIIFVVLDLIWACVLIAISKNDLSGKEKGILYGRIIVLYTALISLHIGKAIKYFRIRSAKKSSSDDE